MITSRRVGFAAAVVAALLSSAAADYHEDQDVYINVKHPALGGAAKALPIQALGNVAFVAQEGAHQFVRATSGVGIDHYYIWLCIDGQCVPVDPYTINK